MPHPCRTLILLLALVSGPLSALGYVPTPAELFAQWGAQVPQVNRAILELHTTVFDPAAARPPDPEGGAEPVWPELAERGFHQRVYWIRDTLLAVETFTPQGEPLHLYLDEGLGVTSLDLAGDRHFDPLDVLHPYLPFLGGTVTDWKRGLAEWGIVPTRVSLMPTGKGRTWYRVGGEDAAALLIPGRLALAGLETTVLGGPQPLHLSVRFSDASLIAGESDNREELLYVPHSATVFLEERPLKVIKVARLDADPPLSAFPLERLRRAARIEPQPIRIGGEGSE